MAKTLDTPDFKTEKEEAAWWDSQDELLLNEFEEAAKDGTLIRSGSASAPRLLSPESSTPPSPARNPGSAA